jgi:DNA repair protein RadC
MYYTEEERDILKEAELILKSRINEHEPILCNPPEIIKEYSRMKFAHLEHEEFGLILLDRWGRFIESVKVAQGTIDRAEVFPREVVKAALRYNAQYVVFIHNHPSGRCEPGASDKQTTWALMRALELVDVRVVDHVIVGVEGSYSFLENKLIPMVYHQ